jgi:ATP/maltotriose-dependent transcriptional regulator MalT
MTRIAIVAESEEIRGALVKALQASPAFEIVGVGESVNDVASAADVVLVARRGSTALPVVHATAGDILHEPALTNREREVLALLADGLGNKQIAARLGIATSTVKTHLELLFEKLEVSTRAEAVATAVRLGLLML